MTATAKNRRHRDISHEETERLRATVPDDPIRLPPGHLACEGCGVADVGPVVESVPMGRLAAHYTRCADCQRLHDRASTLADGLAFRRTLDTLYALAVVGIEPPEDPSPLVPWMHIVGSSVPWLDPEAPGGDLCSPHPWAHVRLSQRAQIKEAYLLAMRSRVHTSTPALRLPPPWGGACLFCGVGSLPMAPIAVVRRGGREGAAHAIWRRVLTQPTSLGGHGPDLVDGFLCPSCSDALDTSGRGVGVGARARAFEQHVRRTRPEEADRVRSLLDQYDSIILPGWGALATSSPNSEPWAHIVVPPPEDDA
ncbi:hypothetical protein [Nocardioides ochotonae]|uniref:hypothetical protein n=1 Tax=Nocardioides ochotonae TaxID=2685869 RepID=UPI00140B9055|nr:hypothetical protein [Nocardioides ochotonae]